MPDLSDGFIIFIDIYRFYDISVHAGFVGVRNVLFVIGRAEHYYRDVLQHTVLFYCVQKLNAVHFGHLLVQNNKTRIFRLSVRELPSAEKKIKSFSPVVDNDDPAAEPVLERPQRQLHVVLVVFNQQYEF